MKDTGTEKGFGLFVTSSSGGVPQAHIRIGFMWGQVVLKGQFEATEAQESHRLIHARRLYRGDGYRVSVAVSRGCFCGYINQSDDESKANAYIEEVPTYVSLGAGD